MRGIPAIRAMNESVFSVPLFFVLGGRLEGGGRERGDGWVYSLCWGTFSSNGGQSGGKGDDGGESEGRNVGEVQRLQKRFKL